MDKRKTISKQIVAEVTYSQSQHVLVNRVFSTRGEFLVPAVVVPVSMLYVIVIAQTISEINREY